MSKNYIPKGNNAVCPYLTVRGAESQMKFMRDVFGAEEVMRTNRPDGTLGHAEVRIDDSIVMLGEATEQWIAMPCILHVYVEDADKTYKRVLKAGAESLMEPADQFYGNRSAGVKDPAGNIWWLATLIEELSGEEIQRRAADAPNYKK